MYGGGLLHGWWGGWERAPPLRTHRGFLHLLSCRTPRPPPHPNCISVLHQLRAAGETAGAKEPAEGSLPRWIKSRWRPGPGSQAIHFPRRLFSSAAAGRQLCVLCFYLNGTSTTGPPSPSHMHISTTDLKRVYLFVSKGCGQHHKDFWQQVGWSSDPCKTAGGLSISLL
ncbi:uncharacterized protein ACBT44_010350 [Syngnathus typhle]